MGYYSDLFLRPKQATQWALENPSLVRAMGMIILGTLAGTLASFLFAGTVFPDLVLSSLTGDLIRWLLGGIVLLLVGLLFKKLPVNGQSVAEVLSVLAQLNVYGFVLFLLVGILLPVIAIPSLLGAAQEYSKGLIGEDEFNATLAASITDVSDFSPLAIPIVLLATLMIVYSVYVLYLSVQKYLSTTVFKSILVMLLILFVQSFVVFLFSGA